jgi:hypothetical protein
MEGAALEQYPSMMNTSAILNQLMQDVTNGAGENSAAIMSQIDAYIQQHGGLLQQGNQLPGIDMSNPLQSVVIGRNTPNYKQPEMVTTKATPDTPLVGSGRNDGTPVVNPPLGQAVRQEYQNTVSPMIPQNQMYQKESQEKGKKAEAGKGKSARSSKFRGVTKHRRSGRYEAHIWIKELGRQVYLGGYEFEEHAAEAYDIAALKSKGRRTKTNFELTKYSDLLGCINRMTMEELIMAVRRQSQGFSRGTSSFRGVTHHPSGRWEARIGVPGAKHVYLGLFSQEKEAAQAYDRALVRLKGKSASTNFALGDYRKELGDFHRMQSRVLRNDSKFQELSNSPAAFEHWIKNGSEAFPELDSPDMDADLPEDYLQNIPEVQPVADGFRGVSHPIDQFAPLGPAAVAVQEAAAVQKAAETANGSHIDVIYQSSEQTSQGE